MENREKLLFEIERAKKLKERQAADLVLQEAQYEIEKAKYEEEAKKRIKIRDEYNNSNIDPHQKTFEQWKSEKGYAA